MVQVDKIFRLRTAAQLDRHFHVPEQQKLLYKACRRIMISSGMKWDDLYRAALGATLHRGTDYESNFRSGRIAAEKARMIYSWVLLNFPREAQTVHGQLIRQLIPRLRRIRDIQSPRSKKVIASGKRVLKQTELYLLAREEEIAKRKRKPPPE